MKYLLVIVLILLTLFLGATLTFEDGKLRFVAPASKWTKEARFELELQK